MSTGIQQIKAEFKNMFTELNQDGQTVIKFTQTAKANTLLTLRNLSFIVGSLKQFAWAQKMALGIDIAQSIIATGTEQAKALTAFRTGEIYSGFQHQMLAIQMAVNTAKSLTLQKQNDDLNNYMNNINIMTEQKI
jgi:hypothetical protein